MSCFEFVNLSVNRLHSSKYTQWNEVEARLDDFILYFGCFLFTRVLKESIPPKGHFLKRVHTGRYLLPLGRDFTS